MDKMTQQIALENDVLHGSKGNFQLFYNREFDLGRHLEPKLAKPKEAKISLSRMNVATKNVTPPIHADNANRSFLFIKK